MNKILTTSSPNQTDSDKKSKRLANNRIAAKECRRRKTEALSKTAAAISQLLGIPFDPNTESSEAFLAHHLHKLSALGDEVSLLRNNHAQLEGQVAYLTGLLDGIGYCKPQQPTHYPPYPQGLYYNYPGYH